MVANSSIVINRRKEQLAINVNKKIVRHAYRCLTIFSWCSLTDLCKFWFSNADQMISISAFRFPARSGSIRWGPFLFFLDSKNHWKTCTSKKLIFWVIFELFRLFFINSEPFCGYFGTPLGSFFDDFCVSYFTVIFSTIFDKNHKNSKTENIAPDL